MKTRPLTFAECMEVSRQSGLKAVTKFIYASLMFLRGVRIEVEQGEKP
jgi:hypothetical protein